jgi:hypothetical protein
LLLFSISRLAAFTSLPGVINCISESS